MERFELHIEAESRIRWKVYVRFGGEFSETDHSNMARRRLLSLRYCPEIKVEVGNMHCRLNHTLSSVYSVRRGYTISIPITNHNQLCYINSKRIFKGQKNKVPKTTGR